jgi:hypothetical protein
MSYFKKFTDFCAGLAAFVAAVFFIRKYMSFKPKEPLSFPSISTDEVGETIEAVTEKFPSKLEQFITPGEYNDYSLLLPLIFLLLLSAILGRVFARLPHVCFAISLFPATLIAYMFENQLLYEQTGIFLILGALHVIGNFADCIIRDREDGRHRASIASKISSAAGAFFCYFVMWQGAQTPPEDTKEIGHIQHRVLFEMTETDVEIMTKLGAMFLILLAVSLILYNVYFIDAILSLVPAAYVIYQVGGSFYTLAPASLAFITLTCALSHIALCLLENNLSRKEQLKARSNEE